MIRHEQNQLGKGLFNFESDLLREGEGAPHRSLCHAVLSGMFSVVYGSASLEQAKARGQKTGHCLPGPAVKRQT